jgi:hypothetical protein
MALVSTYPGESMLKSLSSAMYRLAGWRAVSLFSALAVLFAVVIVPAAQEKIEALSGGLNLVDLEFYYSPEKVFGMISAYGEEGRAVYRNFAMTWDILYPVVYSTLLALVISILLRNTSLENSAMRMLNLLPFGAMIFDWLENAGIVAMLTAHPQTPSTVARLASAATTAKWSVSALCLLVLLALILRLLGAVFAKRWQ